MQSHSPFSKLLSIYPILDSGGPLVQRDENDLVEIVGVASWISAFPCGAINAVTVYVRVSAFNDWITETIAA